MHAADLCWSVLAVDIDWKSTRASQLVNHFERPSPLTTKSGLARCLREAAADAEQPPPLLLLDGKLQPATLAHLAPRVYDLSAPSAELVALAADVRLTAACSVLKRLVRHGFVPWRAWTPHLTPARLEADAPGGEGGVRESLAAAAVRHVLQASRLRHVNIMNTAASMAAGLDLRAFPPPTAEDRADLAASCEADLALYPLDTAGGEDAAVAEAAAMLFERLTGTEEGDEEGAPPPPATGGEWAVGATTRERLRMMAAALLEQLRQKLPQLDLDGTRNVWVLKPSFGSVRATRIVPTSRP